ncbi:MAG: transposase [Chitinophagaceae bacterium]|nr:transposase [Chitinophagaceae bacterium]
MIEHIFGTIKRQWGYDHILLKGIEKNNGEFALIYLTYNFRRVLNILGIEELKKRLKEAVFNVFYITRTYGWVYKSFSPALSSCTIQRNMIKDLRYLSFCTN